MYKGVSVDVSIILLIQCRSVLCVQTLLGCSPDCGRKEGGSFVTTTHNQMLLGMTTYVLNYLMYSDIFIIIDYG